MAEMAFTIKIPALDRFCDLMERMEISVVRGVADKLAEQEAQKPAQEPPKEVLTQAPAPAPKQTAPKPQAAPEAQKPAQEPPKPEPAQAPAPAEKPAEAKPSAATAPEKPEEPKPREFTVGEVQRAAARMRDEGKLSAVLALLAARNADKISDLKGDALQDFAKRLQEMGATL